jgi:hypothetical protein
LAFGASVYGLILGSHTPTFGAAKFPIIFTAPLLQKTTELGCASGQNTPDPGGKGLFTIVYLLPCSMKVEMQVSDAAATTRYTIATTKSSSAV